MDLFVYNTGLIAQGIIDSGLESVLWIERYNDVGEFEIYAKWTTRLETLLKEDYFLVNTDSEYGMVIETVTIKTDPEKGDYLVVKGRSLESTLDRRIVLKQIMIDTSFQLGIKALLDDNVIASVYPERNFPNFIFSTSADAAVTTPTLKGQFYSQNLLELIVYLCRQTALGFKVVLNSSNQWVFSLYAGKDRSYAQSTNPYVVFSPDFDNLISSEYIRTRLAYKNFALVSGDPRGIPLQRVQYWTPEAVLGGFYRREMFVDASDMPMYIEDTSTPVNSALYLEQLTQRGKQELAAATDLTSFEGKVDLSQSYKYRTDFFLGDIIQLEDNHGKTARVRITEITRSDNLYESTIYPTLETV